MKEALLVAFIVVVGAPVIDYLLGVLGVGSFDLLTRMIGAAKRLGYRASGRNFENYDDTGEYKGFGDRP